MLGFLVLHSTRGLLRALPVPGHGNTAARNLQSMAVIKSTLHQGEELTVAAAAASASSQADDAESTKWFPAAAERRNGPGPVSDSLEGISCWTPARCCTEIDKVGSTFKGHHSSLKSPNRPNEAIDRLEENWKHGTFRVISTTCAQSAPPSLRR